MKLNLMVLILFMSFNSYAQAKYKEITSEVLGETKQIKILLPRSYAEDEDKSFPVIYVLDGDYLFELVAGNVDYYSYWEDMPEAIVVGVNQYESREYDLTYSETNSLPIDDGANFFEFIGKELVDYINDNYATEDFKIIVGHGATANFINYYLIRESPIFDGYIAISPDFAPDMIQYLSESIPALESKVFYNLSVSNKDIKHIMKDTKELHTAIGALSNTNFNYTFEEYDGPSHYAMPAHAIPTALEHMFGIFQPITTQEFEQDILTLNTSPVDYLIQKYKDIDDMYGIKKQISLNDFKAIAAAIKQKEAWDYYQDLSKLAREYYPDALLYKYYSGLYYEHTEQFKKAMKAYQAGYSFDEIGNYTKDFMLDKAEDMKEKM